MTRWSKRARGLVGASGAALLLLALVSGGLAAHLAPPRGLEARSFEDRYFMGPSSPAGVDLTLGGSTVAAHQERLGRSAFALEWTGWYPVERAGPHRFLLTSDDGSWLYVDEQLVIDNGGVHGAVTRDGTVDLERGSRAIRLRYFQAGGNGGLSLVVMTPDGERRRLHGRDFVTQAVDPGTVQRHRALAKARDLAVFALQLWVVVLAGALLRGWCAARTRPREDPTSTDIGPGWAVATGTFLLLAAVHTYPLILDPGGWTLTRSRDAALNAWILAWVAEHLVSDPLALYDANIFHPARATLALSEPLILPGILALPVHWLGASTVLNYNLSMVLGLVATALAGYALTRRLTGDGLAGILGGSLLAFNTHTLVRLGHLQIVHAQCLPLALLFADRLLREGRWRDALFLAGALAGAALTSGYLALFTGVSVAIAFLARAREWVPHRVLSMGGRIALVGLVLGLLLATVLAPYGRGEGEPARFLEEVAQYSTAPGCYLATSTRVHVALWSGPFVARCGEQLFPGFLALGLAGVGALWVASRLRRDHTRMLLAIGAAGFLLSLGIHTPLYEWLHRGLPPFQGLRAVSRWGYLLLVAIAGLAAFGLAALRDRFGHRRLFVPLALVAILWVNVEALRVPIGYWKFEGHSPLYDVIARDPAPGAVVEFPVYRGEEAFRNTDAMLGATRHWRPLVNGYSGRVPDHYWELARSLASFPDEASLAELDALRVRHVVVHPGAYDPWQRARILEAVENSRRLRLESTDARGARLYRLLP